MEVILQGQHLEIKVVAVTGLFALLSFRPAAEVSRTAWPERPRPRKSFIR